MPKHKCLGYPSRSEAVLALTEQGLKDSEIATRTGIPRKNISKFRYYALRHSACRRRDASLCRKADADFRTVRCPIETLDGLRPFAAAQGVTVNELVCRLLDAIVADHLVAAVLDDEETDDD